MDTAQLSKIERGERQAKKETVLKIAVILKVEEKEFDDQLRLNASSVSIRSICLRRKLFLLLLEF